MSDAEMVRIFDTTLRDGEQAARVNLNVAEKVQIAKQLAALGIDVVEAGFPSSSPGDFACVQAVAREVRGPVIAALARTTDEDVKAAAAALEGAERKRIHVFIATSPIHMEYKLRMTPQQVMAEVRRAIPLARSLGAEVEFGAEDSTRAEPAFLIELCKAAVAGGATILNLADTVGYTTPTEFADLLRTVIAGVAAGPGVVHSVHCHNDLGMAVANSLAAVKAGVRQIEGTINGIGERAGNAALEEIIMALRTRQGYYGADVGIDTTKLVSASRLVSRLTGIAIPPNKAVVGSNAFTHESGIHQHGVLANRETYEVMKAEHVGAEAAVMYLGKHSGRHAFRDRLVHLGYNLSPEQLDRAFSSFKVLCDDKKEASDGDIEALVAEIISAAPEQRYTLESYEIECGTGIRGGPTARVVLRTNDGRELCDAAVGNGPIDASYIAVQRIIKLDLALENFSVNATSRQSDSVGEAQVTVRHHTGLSASGRGISTDVVKASIMAFVGAVNNLYMVGAAREVKINGK